MLIDAPPFCEYYHFQKSRRGSVKGSLSYFFKVRFLRESYPHLDIEVDGGVGPATIEEVAKAR